MCYQNKFTINPINSTDSIEARNVNFSLYVDWPEETHNGRAFQVCLANLNPSLKMADHPYIVVESILISFWIHRICNDNPCLNRSILLV